MKYGKPIIACNSGGTPEVVKHRRSGILIEPGNPIQLTDAILELAKNKELRQSMGTNGLARMKSNFSLEKLIDTTCRQYQENIS